MATLGIPQKWGFGFKPRGTVYWKVKAQSRKEDIVIVGAGIAGLATAVALRRLGIRSLVLEQAPSLRIEGTSVTFFKNGWKALDALGVAAELRPQFLEIQGIVVKTEDGRELKSFRIKDEDESQEIRAVERRVLLETLASKLPSDAISFSSKLQSVKEDADNATLLQLEDGSQVSAKIVIACDGIRSPVAKWMGFPDAQYVGYSAFRGLAWYPDGQPNDPNVVYIYGRGVRAAYVPVSSTRVYWFVCYNSLEVGPKITDPTILKKLSENFVHGWPSELLDAIKCTPDDNIIRSPLVDRWLLPGISPPVSKGKVVLVGDAWHPMTPNLGQGACCALEDAVILSKKLGDAINNGRFTVEEAFAVWLREMASDFPINSSSKSYGSPVAARKPSDMFFQEQYFDSEDGEPEGDASTYEL